MQAMVKPTPTQLVIVVDRKCKGRTTVWPVICPDGCAEVQGVEPPTRERGVWFAQDHLNNGHQGMGAIRVMRQRKGKRR